MKHATIVKMLILDTNAMGKAAVGLPSIRKRRWNILSINITFSVGLANNRRFNEKSLEKRRELVTNSLYPSRSLLQLRFFCFLLLYIYSRPTLFWI